MITATRYHGHEERNLDPTVGGGSLAGLPEASAGASSIFRNEFYPSLFQGGSYNGASRWIRFTLSRLEATYRHDPHLSCLRQLFRGPSQQSASGPALLSRNHVMIFYRSLLLQMEHTCYRHR
jgi:hypothetical protein